MNKKNERNDNPPFDLLDSDEPAFCSRKSPMTREELEILAEMRKLKEQARKIRSRLAKILPDWKQLDYKSPEDPIPREAKIHFKQLDELRIKWKEYELTYQEARHRRMVALGYEDL